MRAIHPASAYGPSAAGVTPPGRTGNAHPNITPYDIFPTATDPLFLAVGNDRQFRILCEALGAAALADDPRYASNGQRCANRQALTRSLAALLSRHAAQGLAERLIRAGVPCSSVLDIPRRCGIRRPCIGKWSCNATAMPAWLRPSSWAARRRVTACRRRASGQHQLELDFPAASGR